jgi:hypothetical protein
MFEKVINDEGFGGMLCYSDETGNAGRNVPGCRSEIIKAVAGACCYYRKGRA